MSDSQLSLSSAFEKYPARWTAAGLAVILLAALGCLWRVAASGGNISHLSGPSAEEWIVFPNPPNGAVHQVAVLEGKFRWRADFGGAPRDAMLSIRALKLATVTVNGTPLPTPAGVDAAWRDVTSWDIARQLHAGTNEIIVSVVNTNGPPALWAEAQVDGRDYASGTDWDVSLVGSSWQKAALASAPAAMQGGSPLEGAEHPAAAFGASLGLIAVFAGIAAAIYFAGKCLLGKLTLPWKQGALVLGIPLALWLALFWNNLGALPYVIGFDSIHHLEYIRQVRMLGHLPLAGEGYQTYQPPLYYLISAAWLLPFNAGDWTDHAAELVRILGFGIGAAQFVLVYLCLRLLFPGRTDLQLAGLLMSAFVPPQLYLSQFVTNETLSVTLVTAAFYFCLRILTEDRDAPWLYGALGACLGAALLTKVTGIIAVPFIGAALAGRLVIKRQLSTQLWTKTLGLCAGAALLVCGWHYARVWLHFGKFIVGNWDATSAPPWWMERGYTMAGYFLHGGGALNYPWFSGFNSFADGLYSTLWGDGLWGGETSLAYRPPWNYQLMGAGYLLALFPTALALIGLGCAVRRFAQRREPAWFLMLGTAGGTLAALVYMTLKVPSYGEVKAFYGMIAMLPLCVFVAAGWELVLRAGKWIAPAGAVILGVWALTSYGSFWIRRGNAGTQAAIGQIYEGIGDDYKAGVHFEMALQKDPENLEAQKGEARELAEGQQFGAARQRIEGVLKNHPNDAEAHAILASILMGQNQTNEALTELRGSVLLATNRAENYALFAEWLEKQGLIYEASLACRAGLRADPFNPQLHYDLGMALVNGGLEPDIFEHFRLAVELKPNWPEAEEQLGLSLLANRQPAAALPLFNDAAERKPKEEKFHYNLAVALNSVGHSADAAREYQKALSLTPDYPEALNNLAWLLATDADPQLRNGSEAVRFATRACELTERKQPVFIATLGAGYAETGRFADAIAATTEAAELGRNAGNTNFVGTCDKLLQLYRAGQAYHQPVRPVER